MSNNNQNTEYLTNAILEEMVRQLRMEQTPPPSPPPRNRHVRNNQQNRLNNGYLNNNIQRIIKNDNSSNLN